jgi:hypothetical protein
VLCLRSPGERVRSQAGALMGYPMTWSRLLERNNLKGNYSRVAPYPVPPDSPPGACRDRLRMISGDLRRLERDSVDGDTASIWIAREAGVSLEDTLKVMKAFFSGAPKVEPHDPA